MSWRQCVASTEGTQCRVQRWRGRTIDKRKLPGNRTWGSGELWTKLQKKQKQSKAWNFFHCSGWGSFFFLPGKIPYCCGPWLLSITILPFPQRKFSLAHKETHLSLMKNTIHPPPRDPGCGPRYSDWMGLGVDIFGEAVRVFYMWRGLDWRDQLCRDGFLAINSDASPSALLMGYSALWGATINQPQLLQAQAMWSVLH